MPDRHRRRPRASRSLGALLAFAPPAAFVVWSLGSSASVGAPESAHASEPATALAGIAGMEAAPSPFNAPLELVYEEDTSTEIARSSSRTAFRLQVRDIVIPYPVMAITALPGETIELRIEEGAPATTAGSAGYRLRDSTGLVPAQNPGRWSWQAPTEPGPVPLRVEGPSGEAIHLNVLVLHPFDHIDDGGSLNGYRIGQYRPAPGRDLPPAGFVEATLDVLDLRVTPHFTLRQFLCKQPGEPPYLAVSEPLLLKLEAILEEVHAAGIEAETLQIMSGFRTPEYNRAIGNVTDGSRHLWGDAADVFIDATGNGWMDDLNGDGEVGLDDGAVLYEMAERVERRGEGHVLPGGLSLYSANSVHGPFVHVDARGVAARW